MNALSEFLHAQAELPEVKAAMDKIVSDVMEAARQEELKQHMAFIRGLTVAAEMARDVAPELHKRLVKRIRFEEENP